jgi:hypothetical protein
MEAVTDAVRQPELFLVATQAKAMSYLATGRCRERDRLVRRRALAAATAFVGKAARCIGQKAAAQPSAATNPEVVQYCKRLHMINAIFADSGHHIDALSDLLRTESS